MSTELTEVSVWIVLVGETGSPPFLVQAIVGLLVSPAIDSFTEHISVSTEPAKVLPSVLLLLSEIDNAGDGTGKKEYNYSIATSNTEC